jgi:hypothetical protein
MKTLLSVDNLGITEKRISRLGTAQFGSGAITNRKLALFLERCWLSAVTINRPGNGQDLPLPINFAHLPDFEA